MLASKADATGRKFVKELKDKKKAMTAVLMQDLSLNARAPVRGLGYCDERSWPSPRFILDQDARQQG